MSPPGYLRKIMTWEGVRQLVRERRELDGKAVFTNGCFDLIHTGHLRYLSDARDLGDLLIVGLNSDRSVREIKGPARPIIPQDQRAEVLAALEFVDAVTVFDEPDPLELIKTIEPDILVKGGDWPLDRIVGRREVEERGGRVMTIDLVPGQSTSGIIEKIMAFKRQDRNMKEIPLCIPELSREEEEAVIETIRSHWLIQGPKNREFEAMFADYIGVKRAVSCNSGTSALFLALLALGVKGEVILPSFTFAASANAVLAAGCEPVFADINYNDLNMDPADVEHRITPRTEALMVVHFGGQPADMDALTGLADKYGLALIEDSAETIGGEYKGRKAGSFGTGCFSFQPTKNLTTGEGGMTVTNDDRLADRIATLLGHGIEVSSEARAASPTPWHRSVSLVGFNMRLTNFQAAMGVVQMKKLNRMNRDRQTAADGLIRRLSGLDGLELPATHPERTHVWQMFTVKVKDGLDRDGFVRFLRARGVGASVHFQPPVHLQDYYLTHGYGQTDLPQTERAAQNIITLPMYPGLTEDDLDYMAEVAAKALAEQSAD